MAYRELHVVEIREVLRLWALGEGFRPIARQTHVDRKTVRRYVGLAQELGLERGAVELAVSDELLSDVGVALRPGAPPTVGGMRDHCRAHQALLEGWLKEGCRGPKLVKLLARHSGVTVPLRTLQRFIAEDLGRPDRSTVRVVDPEPGVLEMDFLELGVFTELATGETRKLYALLLTASVSRHQFLWPCLSQTRQDAIEGLEAAWEFFGGVFPVLLPDNTKAVVAKADPVAPVFNRDFVEYAQSRGFRIDPARARKPRDKARVERQVRYVRDDYFKGERFGCLEETRIEARRWCWDDAGMRDHGTTRCHPREAFEQGEKAVLLPAPTQPYDTPTWGDYVVGRDHAVVVGYALYSVPYGLGEVTLRVRSDRSTVKFYKGAQLVKVHPRQPEGGSSIDPADLPPGKAELATRDTASLVEQAKAFGPHVEEYARRLAEGPLPWSRMRHIYRLMGLARRYGAAVTDEACARALEVGVVNVQRIDGMLRKGLATRRLLKSSPRPTPQAKVLRFARSASAFRLDHGGSDVPA